MWLSWFLSGFWLIFDLVIELSFTAPPNLQMFKIKTWKYEPACLLNSYRIELNMKWKKKMSLKEEPGGSWQSDVWHYCPTWWNPTWNWTSAWKPITLPPCHPRPSELPRPQCNITLHVSTVVFTAIHFLADVNQPGTGVWMDLNREPSVRQAGITLLHLRLRRVE